MIKILNNPKLMILLCCTLGLAPFFPEPHLWGKMKWIAGGGTGMKPLDWFDALFHSLPWLLLVRIFILMSMKKLKA
jgi:hypothetical protein